MQGEGWQSHQAHLIRYVMNHRIFDEQQAVEWLDIHCPYWREDEEL